MASSDDEEETFADTVSDYYFCDGDDEPLSFSKLPWQWDESESENSSPTTEPIYLRGTADNGLRKLYRPVKAWKYDSSNFNPEILVLSKDNRWIKLQKPRKSFENEIRTILITVHCLSYLKIKPEASAKSLWDHLSKVFSLYDVRPSENDLRDHMNFVRDAVDRDVTLSESKFLAAFLENPRKRKISEEAETVTKPSFIVDDTNGEPQDDDFFTEPNEDSDSDEEEDHFDSVCAICDNGGELTCCEGKCFRSFHATPDTEEAEDSNCQSLGLTPEQVKVFQLNKAHQFRCENCMYNLHQCFVCGKLGSSDKSSGAEVFRCSSATCGHFYHPKCVAKRLHPNVESEQKNLLEKIGSGEPFICPAHKCDVCNQTENEIVKDLQFAICRRCPTSYHRKCLPSDIMFESEIGDDDIVRAWDNLLSKSRALIYCLNHEIDEELGTPARTLILQNIRNQPSKLPLKKKKTLLKESSEFTTKKPVIKSQKTGEKNPSTKMEDSISRKRTAIPISGSVPLKKKKLADTSKKPLKRSLSAKVKTASSNDGQPSLGSRLFDYVNKGTELEPNNVVKDDVSVDESKQIESGLKEILPPIDEDSKQRILDLMKDASSSITLDEVRTYHRGKVPSTHLNSSRVDKTIILARVEGAVEALHVALKKLEEGCSLEDAMAVCEPRVLDQLWRWKDKLKLYLGPFLHGKRYTSYGRHFTKVEKLEKIADKLKFYVEDGDTVVDFCCGANDFSSIMKKHLDEMGKNKVSYKNYDISRPKNDFFFERRDWMSVRPRELPKSSNLIMGLNPPFGKNAGLANQFIQQAVKFMPKLLILIVPPETERLDSEKQKCPYDLVWEDDELLAGKSFYLPGSIDVNAKQVDQWNNTTPFLYLWSRPDMTLKHKTIAQQHGHIPPPPTALPDETLPEPTPSTDDIPVFNKDPEPNTETTKPNTKKLKNKSPSKKKQQTPPNQNSKKKKFKTDNKQDDSNKHSLPQNHEINHRHSPIESPHETVISNNSYSNDVSQPVPERKYNPPPPSDYSSRSPNYSYYNRRPDAQNRLNEPPPVQYHNNPVGGYDRVGSYFDDMGSRGPPPPPPPHHEPMYGGHHPPHNNNNNNNGNRSGTSTMQRYAPRLDELNHTRMGNTMEDMNHSRMRPMVNRVGGYGPPMMHAPGFAPGPYNPYSQNHNSSGGWLNE
ncbi:hypothetical protein LXL04_031015 [Taraxacum kok-saghyz]